MNRNKVRRTRLSTPTGETYTALMLRVRLEQFEDDPRCSYCGREFARIKRTTVDHVKPLNRGGRHCDENLLLCCGACNLDKADYSLSEWCDKLQNRLIRVRTLLGDQQG